MDRDGIEKLVHTWATEGVAAGRLEVFDQLLDPQVVDLSSGREVRGSDTFKARAAMVRDAFSQRSCTVDALVVDGDRIAWRWTVRGVHSGAFGDVPPTQKSVGLSGTNFQRIHGGRVVEHWTMADVAGLLRQIRPPAGSLTGAGA